jgi:hypothetical protein
MKSGLTLADVSPDSLKKEEARVAHLQQAVDRCRQQLAAAEDDLNVATASFSWRCLMRDVCANDDAQKALATIVRGIQGFESNLSEPAGYDAEGDSDGVPFRASDDYGDFSSVEAAVDTVTASIETLMERGAWESGFLSLLVLTTQVGQMGATSGSSSSAGAKAATPTTVVGGGGKSSDATAEEMRTALQDVEYDEMKDEIAGLWTRFVCDQEGSVPDSVAARWRRILEQHIGPPFDALSAFE